MGMQTRSKRSVERLFGLHCRLRFNGIFAALGIWDTSDFKAVIKFVIGINVNDTQIDLGGTRFLNLCGDRMRVLAQLPIDRPPIIYNT